MSRVCDSFGLFTVVLTADTWRLRRQAAIVETGN